MASHELDKGLGLAAIGVVTFFGTAVSSSIFEEHRHSHGTEYSNKVFVGKDVSEKTRERIKDLRFEPVKNAIEEAKKANWTKESQKRIRDEYEKEVEFTIVKPEEPSRDDDGNFIHGVIAGTGIMRKALAASLVITYIVLIGFSYSEGTLYVQIAGTGDNQTQTIAPSHILLNQTVHNNGTEEITEKLLDKNYTTLIQHFTIVVSVVIGFYFGSNAFSAYLNKMKESTNDGDEIKKKIDLQQDTIKEMLGKMDPASDNNKLERFKELYEKLKEETSKTTDQRMLKSLQEIIDEMEKIQKSK